MSRPLRILLFSTLFPSSARPLHGVFVDVRLRHLLRSGCVEARVVAPVPWFPLRAERFGEYARFARTPKREVLDRLDVYHPRYPLPPKVGMTIAPMMLALGALGTLRTLLREGFDFDVIDAHYFYPDCVAAAMLGRWLGKPVVATARGSDLNVLAKYRGPRAWMRWASRRLSASICVSGALKSELQSLTGQNSGIHVVRNGVDAERFAAMDRATCRAELGLTDHDWLLFVGRLSEAKGVQHAIRALARLPGNVRLAVVGDGPDGNRFRELAEELDLAERVEFRGSMPQEQLPRWYSAACALLLPSKSEGMPNVVLEAIACGTPVVATAVGGIPEVVANPAAGRLVDAPSPESLAAAILDILDQPPGRDSVREIAARFSWEKATDAQIEIFDAVLTHA